MRKFYSGATFAAWSVLAGLAMLVGAAIYFTLGFALCLTADVMRFTVGLKPDGISDTNGTRDEQKSTRPFRRGDEGGDDAEITKSDSASDR